MEKLAGFNPFEKYESKWEPSPNKWKKNIFENHHLAYIWVFTENGGFSPQIIHFNRGFPL